MCGDNSLLAFVQCNPDPSILAERARPNLRSIARSYAQDGIHPAKLIQNIKNLDGQKIKSGSFSAVSSPNFASKYLLETGTLTLSENGHREEKNNNI